MEMYWYLRSVHTLQLHCGADIAIKSLLQSLQHHRISSYNDFNFLVILQCCNIVWVCSAATQHNCSAVWMDLYSVKDSIPSYSKFEKLLNLDQVPWFIMEFFSGHNEGCRQNSFFCTASVLFGVSHNTVSYVNNKPKWTTSAPHFWMAWNLHWL